MKKHFALLMACMLVCGVFTARAGLEIYYYDLADTEKIHHSSGTGGTAWHGFMERTAYSYRGEWATDESPFEADINAYIRQWTQEAWANWGYGDVDVAASEYAPRVTLWTAQDGTQLLTLQVNQTGVNTLANAQVAGACLQSQLFDWTNGRALRLSDLFYDGFDYIPYVNHCVANAEDYMQDYEHLELWPLTDNDMRRPFTGLPNDYPFISFTGGSVSLLSILLEDSNPFWSDSREYNNPGEALVPLLHSNSPYGSCQFGGIRCDTDVSHAGITLQRLASISLDGSTAWKPAIVQRMDAACTPLLQQLQMEPQDAKRTAQPGFSLWQDRLHVRYDAWMIIEPFSYNGTSVHIGNVNADSGACNWLDGLLAECLLQPQVAYYALAPLCAKEEQLTLLVDYQLPENSQALYTWESWQRGNDLYWLLVQTPDGEYVQVQMPKEIYDAYSVNWYVEWP